MKHIYLVFAILGAIIPYFYFIQFFHGDAAGFAGFIAAISVNHATKGVTADVTVASLVFWIYMFQQMRQRQGPQPYLFMVLNLAIGLSCALPAYLYLRERRKALAGV